MLASALGTWMQIVAQSLLVLRITGNSALALGTVSLAQASAFFLFAPMGGDVRGPARQAAASVSDSDAADAFGFHARGANGHRHGSTVDGGGAGFHIRRCC